MSKRGITIIVVVILGALALATWGGTRLGDSTSDQQPEETQEGIDTLTNELAQVRDNYILIQENNEELSALLASTKAALLKSQAEYNALVNEKAVIEVELSRIESALVQAQVDYANLQRSYNRLQSRLTSAENEVTTLQRAYQNLSENYDDILDEQADVKADYNYLSQRYSVLEGTKQFTLDNRLRVNLSTETEPGETSWVIGEIIGGVTNISNRTISRVYVLISRYNSDGTLASLDLPPSLITNLAPGEVGYFNFSSTGESCKITVIGDY